MRNTLIDEHFTDQNTFPQSFKTTLLATLQQAQASATTLHKRIIASFTLPVEHYEIIQAFEGIQHAALGDVFFWEQPSEHNALLGVGTEIEIETVGKESAASAATQWRMLQQEAVVGSAGSIHETDEVYGRGPLFFGGFAFDPQSQHTPLWSGFPDGLLLLPRFLLRYRKEKAALTVNVCVSEDDELMHCLNVLETQIRHLFFSIGNSLEKGTYEQTKYHGPLDVEDILPASEWMHKVETVASDIRAGLEEKVVLARSVCVTPSVGRTFAIGSILSNLRQNYPKTYVFAMQRGDHYFVGATPERLVQAQDGLIHTMALAGSAPRGKTPQEDEQIGTELLQSKKNALEHAIVAEMIRKALIAQCSTVHISNTPHLLKLKNVQHLETPIEGELLPGRCILDVIAGLHPTPAVGGFPREKALETLRSIEQLDRGWYAGPLGWIGASGHGEFAVALRSGLITEREATLFAGCGIVGDSDPQSEYVESYLKLQVMLLGLGKQD